MFLIFNSRVAEIVGGTAAVVFENIVYWIRNNELNERNFYDGRYWTYNSCKVLAEHFTCYSEKQIFNAITKLVEANLVIVGNYNQTQADRTRWYAIGENGVRFYEESCKKHKEVAQLVPNLIKHSTDKPGNSISQVGESNSQNGKLNFTLYTNRKPSNDIQALKETGKKRDQQQSFFDSDDEESFDTFDTPIPTEKPKEPQKFIRITVPPCLTCEWDEGYKEAHDNDPDYEKHWYEKWGKYFDGNNTVPREMVVLYDEKTGASYDEKMIPLNPAAFALENGSQQSENGQCFSTDPNTPISFEEFWTVYDLKTDKIKCRKLFDKLSKDDRIAIHQNLQAYVDSTPDKQFRKKPHRWLENRCWEDEIVSRDRFGRQPRDYTGL